MTKQTKNIITREFIEKELRFLNTADMKSILVTFFVFTLIFLPMTMIGLFIISSMSGTIWIKIILALLVGGLTSAPIWFALIRVCRVLSERKLLMRGDFNIVACEVSSKKERVVHRHIAEFLCFNDFEEYCVGHTTYQLASVGDTFYIVHYKGKRYIQLLYSSKMYELKN